MHMIFVDIKGKTYSELVTTESAIGIFLYNISKRKIFFTRNKSP